MLSFEFGGQTYRLEFQRNHKEVEVHRGGRVMKVTSQHPYTTATLLLQKTKDTYTTYAEATVGCYTHDKYLPDLGRRFAIEALRSKLRKSGLPKDTLKDLMKILWFTYLHRAELQGKKKNESSMVH